MQQENNLAIEKEEETTVEIELPTEGVEENVEVVEEEADSDPKSEQEEYSDSVQKRINKLTYKLRETERQNEEAVTWAQKVQEENAKLKKKADTANSAMFTEYDNRVKTELESAKAEYKDAYDRGDTDSIVNANEKLSRLSVESESLRRVSAKRKQADEDGVEIPVTDTVIPASPNPQPAQPDPMAQQWAEKNQWFGKDQGLTFAAFGIHRELMDEGYDGTTNDYYKELDNRLSNFGNRNYTDNEQVLDSPVQRVASPSRQARTTNARSKKIKLTQSQVAIAKKLGVPLEEYAKYVKQ